MAEMNEASAIALVYGAIWTIVVAAGPAVIAAMVVGVGIALLQALTQIQEVTLTFIPKIVVILLVIVVTAPFIGSQIQAFATDTYDHIADGF
jgi:flagellar biosynthetic protein FliQ